MPGERSLIVGIDLTNDYSQLSIFSENDELYSVSITNDPQRYRIPTVLCAMYGSGEWLIGDEAMQIPESPTCVRITDIVSCACEGKNRRIFDTEYTPDMILEKFFRRLLGALKVRTGGAVIQSIAITVPHTDPSLVAAIGAAFDRLGILKSDYRIISHLESFMYYVVSQNSRDIWISDVGLFDFDQDGFVCYMLSFGRKQVPLTIVAQKHELTRRLSLRMLELDETDRCLKAFENIVEEIMYRQSVSALYFTGIGFESAWADEVLKRLCSGRRVFRGQNLFVKGAAYAAKLFVRGESANYLLVGDDVLKCSISIRVIQNGGYFELPLVEIGQPYMTAAHDIDIIMDETNELDFIVHNVLKKDFVCAIMTLDGLDVRKDRTTRLNVSLSFPNRDTCVITVRDTGFGSIYKTNYRIWEQTLKI